MPDVVRPSWLDAPPDQSREHDYLDPQQVATLPEGAFFKRKSSLTRHRYIKATLSVDGRRELVEFVDNRGSWRVQPATCERIAALLGRDVAPMPADRARALLGGDSNDHGHGHGHGHAVGLDELVADGGVRWQLGVLDAAGLAPLVLPMAVPPAPGHAEHPRTMTDILELYGEYTDMEAQGHFAEDSPDLERFQRMLAWVPRGGDVLDLGCNSGAFGEPLVADGCRVIGVDLAHGLLGAAAARGVVPVLAFAERLPLAGGCVDAVICGELLEHSLDPAAIVREAARVLRPGGVLVGSVPHADGQWGTEDLQYHKEHLWAFSPATLGELLRAEGLAGVETVDLHHGCPDPQGIVFRARKPAP